MNEIPSAVAQAFFDSNNRVSNVAFTDDEVTITLQAELGTPVEITVNPNAEGDGVVYNVSRAS